jgi:hypothetical protein
MDEKKDNEADDVLHRDDKYTCEVGSIVGCRKDPNGTLSLAECSEECTLEKMQLYIPSTVTDSFSYSPFKYIASIAGIVKPATITIKYPWPASMSEMLLDVDSEMYKDFHRFLKSTDIARVISGFASPTPENIWLIMTLLLSNTNMLLMDQYIDIHDIGKIDKSTFESFVENPDEYCSIYTKKLILYMELLLSTHAYEDFEKYGNETYQTRI